MPVGWAVLVVSEALLDYVNPFLPFRLSLICLLFSISVVGALILAWGVVRSLASVESQPAVQSLSARGLVVLVSRLIIPAFLAMPLAWLILNRFRSLSYDADNPNEFHFQVIHAQGHLARATVLLLPIALAMTVYYFVRENRRVNRL